jgi:predicted HicB family RNase H-like nuclease
VTAAAHEVSAQLPAGRVEVRLEAGDPVLSFLDEAPAPPAYPAEDTSARITLRLPEALKGSVEAAAAREGVSVNSWLVQTLARAVESRPSRGNRLTGFARS